MARSDNLSLNALKLATGQSVASLVTCSGNGGADPVPMSEFTVEGLYGPIGYTYIVENTTETYSIDLDLETEFFYRIGSRPANTSWNTTGSVTITSELGTSVTITASDMNPQSPSSQTSLQTILVGTVCFEFVDGYNTDATNYGVEVCKTVYSVDSYDGNSAALCLTADSPVILSDGTRMEAGDLIEGDKLIGYSIGGIPPEDDFDYLSWNTDDLRLLEKEVTLVNLTYSFSEKYYSINDGEIKATSEHPMLVFDKETNLYTFKQMFNLKVGDKLIHSNEGVISEVEIYKIDVIGETVEIVSLDVETQDTYLVNGYITHNKGGNTHTDLTAPSTPTGLAYSDPNVSWNAVSGADSYQFQVATDTGFTALQINVNTATATSWDVSALSLGTYYARVKAIDHGLSSSYTSYITVTIAPPVGEAIYDSAGTFNWTAPEGVTSVCVVCVGGGGGGVAYTNGTYAMNGGGGGGLGYKNNITVVPGNSYTVVVGVGGAAANYSASGGNGGNSYFISSATVRGGGGIGGRYNLDSVGGNYVGDGGGNGGGTRDSGSTGGGPAGGGGAGGYAGAGGHGVNYLVAISLANGTGGASAGGACNAAYNTGYGGGGTGLYGQGTSGFAITGPGQGGSGGLDGSGNTGGIPGGGGGGSTLGTGTSGDGAIGGVRIIWGTGRAFPSTGVGACSTFSITLGTDNSGENACVDKISNGGSTYYGDNASFSSCTELYSNTSCVFASAGYYSDGANWRYWTGTAFTTSGACIL